MTIALKTITDLNLRYDNGLKYQYLGGPPIPPIAEKAGEKGQLTTKRGKLRPNYCLINPKLKPDQQSNLPSLVATFFVSGWSVKTQHNTHNMYFHYHAEKKISTKKVKTGAQYGIPVYAK